MSHDEKHEIRSAVDDAAASQPNRRGILAGLGAVSAGGLGRFASRVPVLADSESVDAVGKSS